MSRIELVVLDMAGTTVNDEDGVNRCIRDSLKAVGLAVASTDVNRVMGLPKPRAISLLIEQYGRSADLSPGLESIHADFVRRSMGFYASDPSVHEIPGASRLFDRLHSGGLRVALNTGFNRAITDVILDRMRWGERIDAAISSDEVSRGRPYPDMIRELMRRLGVSSASRVAKVGDTPADLEEGHNAGCGLVVGVTSGTHTREELTPFPHTHLIESIRDLPELLGLHATDLGS
jgi:phosphonatase-like hydrolase